MQNGYFLKVRHPTSLYGVFSLVFKGKEISNLELKEGALEITEEMGGSDLVNYLVRVEGYTDISNRAPVPEPGRTNEDKSTAWDLTSPNASDERLESGHMGILVRGVEKQLAVVRNVIHTDDLDVRTQLLREGFKIVKSYDKPKNSFVGLPQSFQEAVARKETKTVADSVVLQDITSEQRDEAHRNGFLHVDHGNNEPKLIRSDEPVTIENISSLDDLKDTYELPQEGMQEDESVNPPGLDHDPLASTAHLHGSIDDEERETIGVGSSGLKKLVKK